jgi:hypothetical protein
MYAIEIEPWHELIGCFRSKRAAEKVLKEKGFRHVRLETWMREGEKVGEEEFAEIREIHRPDEHGHI